MDLTSLFHLLIAFGALQALFLAIILGTRKRELSAKLFATFLFIEGFTLVERLVAETGLMSDIPHILGISYPFEFHQIAYPVSACSCHNANTFPTEAHPFMAFGTLLVDVIDECALLSDDGDAKN